jgi:hypothetical protein
VTLFAYLSPVRRWGLIFVGAGAALLRGAVWFFIKSVVEAGTGGTSVFAPMSGRLVVAVIAFALIVGGATGLFVSWFGPTSLDDYEGPGDEVIWGRCPRSYRNAKGTSACAQCGRALPPPKSIW